MKRLIILLTAGLILNPTLTNSAQTAQARLFCWSLRFQGATAVDGNGFNWTMNLTTLASGVNGELAQGFFNSGYTHSAYMEMDHELYGAAQGAMALDVPDAGDANGNGFPDFFEVSQAVNSLPSSGAFQSSEIGNGSISATWYREAGASMGYCTIIMPDPFSFSGDDLIFFHPFELIEYTGSLSYTPGSNTVSGSLDLVQTGNTDNTFQGPIEFTKAMNDPFDELTLRSLFLTNASMQTLTLYTSNSFFRDVTLLTNYYGDVEFSDGNPNTGADDYYDWMLSIDDLNDTDNDTIPDFSDDPGSLLPRHPVLTLTRGTTNLWLTISGDIGHMHRILEAASLTPASWFTNQSVQLTNDPQTVSLPLPSSGVRFWRVLAE